LASCIALILMTAFGRKRTDRVSISQALERPLLMKADVQNLVF
jgi:hypothetical protein